MTLISAIILDAYRESNLVARGVALSADEEAEGLTRLSSLVAGVFGYDAGEQLLDWPVGTSGWVDKPTDWSEQDWVRPLENSRLLISTASAQTIYLPTDPTDGARISVVDLIGNLATYNITLSANGRYIEGAAQIVLSENGLTREWVYRADTANWQRVTALVLTDEMPFPPEFDDFFIIKLAARLNPRFGRSLGDVSLMRLQEMQEQLASRYRQSRPAKAPTAVTNLSTPNRYYRTGIGRGRFGWMG